MNFLRSLFCTGYYRAQVENAPRKGTYRDLTFYYAGLSGFAPATTTTLSILLQQVLAQTDLYFFWQAGLLMLGIRAWSGVTRKKSFLIIVFCVLIVLMVQAGLGLGIEKLSNLSLNTSMLGGFMR